MADNISITEGTGKTIATDDVSGVQHQLVKLEYGTDGSATQVSDSNPLPIDDAGGSVTVDGTVTANLSATDNAVLDDIAADTEAIKTAVEGTLTVTGGGGGTEYTEDAAAAANPVGNALIMVRDDALSGQTTTDGDNVAARGTDKGELYVKHVDAIPVTDNSSTLSVDDGGSTLTVDGTVTANLSATDNGVLDNIDSDTSNIQTAVQLLDDTVYTDDADWTNDTSKHLLVGGVYQSSQHTVTDGDVSPLAVDANGNLRVNIMAGAGSGGTAQADDADFTDGTTQGTPAMGVYESTPSTVTDGDLGIVGITEDRELKVKHTDAIPVTDNGGALSIDDGGNTITVDGTVTANLSATDNTVLDNIDADLTTIIGHVDGVEGLLTTIDTDTGNIATAVQTLDNAISGSEMQVDVVAALPAGTNNIGDVDVLSIAAGDNNIGNVDVVTLPALAAGTNAIGKLLAPDIDVTGHTNYAKKYYTSTGAATDGIIWSPAAGKRWHVVSMFINVSAAATVTLEDDKAGGDEAVMKMELAANSGTVINFSEKYPFASGEDAADLLITTSAGNVYVTCTGYEV